ncbi:hypothetical protein P296_04305 [Salmonella enterica subsp. arizonae serovar 18:z4,z23:- str. CVM N26624]|uniref:Uncharacterized protein n=2 Tax=Salmonella enterica subsp. arizonae serovar 18:z4,z23:- TaxID=1192839 RepID=A0A3S5YN16_SALER|nr:hypothetical protein P296_04305 [Salmonella enterica subsp. arizonae serovar 18:z4,z23:- str. CVM N26624]OLW00398.1 hypothetical protein P297_12390 [Salmonella enterica subsp. arizonae serovar 18:z4,z23:- str. CVM N26625]OLW03074.1 hypothetical protein P298_00270 [Salmonella enterica subsp. arizonae serovar 18:z4,z23:- str. CVM N26626]OLW10094.1 hypothetical protein P293_17975 [Salmonella enterica subsp. arizonae serovar 18:z4,z23:- str. CVM N20028]OLW12160.1 hypothetical protein P295_09390 
MNFLTKKRVMLLIFLVPVLLYIGYELFLSRKLSPPADSERLTVSFRVPEGVTLLPLGGLYESSECTNTNFTAGGNTYQADATTGVSLPFVSQGSGNIMSVSIAKDGGGRCRWKLSRIRVHFRLSDDSPLSKGRNVFDTSYLFDFRDWGIVNTYDTGDAKNVSGNLNITADFFPMIFINHMFKEATLRLFGGDTNYDKWSRHYRLSNTKNIHLYPFVHIDKSVILESPNPPPGNITALYPDGSRDDIPGIIPDYNKLLSMK